MLPEFVANLDGVLALHPGEVVGELPAVVGFKAEAGPLHAELCVRYVARERHVRRPSCLVEKSALVRSPKLVGPTHSGRDRNSAHEPAVPGYCCVIEQVALDDVIKLLGGVLRRNPLIKTVADIIIVLFRRYPGVELRDAAAHLAAVADGGTPRPEETAAGFELIAPLMVHPEDERPEVGNPCLVAGGVARDI